MVEMRVGLRVVKMAVIMVVMMGVYISAAIRLRSSAKKQTKKGRDHTTIVA